MTQQYNINDLKNIMAKLRSPDSGCPWDLKQDLKSIAPYTIEEAYEVVDAIDRGDSSDLCDELGDLLFQVIYHAQLAREDGQFQFDDVIQAICDKLIRRHPHVFGKEELKTDLEIKGMWERIKAEEKSAKVLKLGVKTMPSLLDDIPIGLPGLTRAVKLQNKAASVGFDWPDVTPVFYKIEEELSEVKEAYELTKEAVTSEVNCSKAKDHLTEEIGDLLFVITNLARHFKIDPEQAARSANEKFCRRFAYIEKQLTARGVSLADANLEEMDALWDEAKLTETDK